MVRAARERRLRVVSWTGCAGWRAARSTLLSLGSGREYSPHGRQSDCQAQQAPPTRASSRGTMAHPPARPPSCCERADCAGLAIILRLRAAGCCATSGTVVACMRPPPSWPPQPAVLEGAPGRRAGRRRNACNAAPVAKAASASEPASRTAEPAWVQRNFATRLCLISKSNHHEDYQLARRLLPLHTLCGHDVDNDDGQPSRKFLM